MRAVLYARVSDPRKQAGDDHFSLPVQQELFHKRCVEKGYTPVGVYSDRESGKSNRTAARAGYQKMLSDARLRAFDVVVVRAIDRFGRDQDEILLSGAELRRAGVKIDPIFTSVQDDTPPAMAKFLGSVEAFIAENESAQISSRVKGTMAASARSGKWQGPAPYGYRSLQGKPVREESEAEVVRRIFEMYSAHNLSPRQIARIFNEEGLRTPHGELWVQQSVDKILRRETYTGTLVWSGERVEGGVPAIIDRDLWEKSQARRRARQRAPGGQTHTSHYLLTGLLWCECGSRMVGRVDHRGGPSKTYYAYVCRGWMEGRSAKSNWHQADDLEGRVIRDLVDSVGPREVRLAPPHSPIHELAEARRDLVKNEARRKKNLDDFSRGVLTDDDFAEVRQMVIDDDARLRQLVATLEQQVADADRARRELESKPELVLKLIDENTSNQDKKAILQTFIMKIIVRIGDPEPYIVA